MQAGCALVGGETAEHPGRDGARRVRRLAAPASASSTPTRSSAPDRVRAGDVLIALGSSGLHSNGYSLVRHVLLERGRARARPTRRPSSAAARSARSCSTPTRIYALDCLALAAECRRARVRPHHRRRAGRQPGPGAARRDLDAVVDRATWAPPPIFDLIAEAGPVGLDQLELTFNLGVGMVAAIPAVRVSDALELMAQRGVPAWVMGDVVEGTGVVEMTGNYSGPVSLKTKKSSLENYIRATLSEWHRLTLERVELDKNDGAGFSPDDQFTPKHWLLKRALESAPNHWHGRQDLSFARGSRRSKFCFHLGSES